MTTRGIRGRVDRHGTSPLPEGIVDHAEGAEDIQLSEELEKRLHDLFNDNGFDVKAKYKLEIAINEERSNSKPFWGLVTAWTNGGFMHGGGDESIYFCPSLVNKNGETKTCSAPLELKWIGKAAAVCPKCRNAVKPSELAGQVGFRLTAQGWARLLVRLWLNLGGDSDVCLSLMQRGIREKTDNVMKNTSPSAGDGLNEIRNSRKLIVYPLANILKDTSAGASLEGRFYAFLNS